MLWVFINDGAVFQMTEVKHSHGAISTHRRKHVSATPSPAKRDVIDLFVMGDQLGLHVARHKIHSSQHLPCLQPQMVQVVSMLEVLKIGIHLIPVKGSQGAQKSEFLLLFSKHSSLVSVSPTLHTRR